MAMSSLPYSSFSTANGLMAEDGLMQPYAAWADVHLSSPDGSAPVEQEGGSSTNQSANQEKITSMFRATHCNGHSDTKSLFQATPPSRPASSAGRPSTAMPRLTGQTQPTEGALMTSIFSINKISYDVHMYDNRITWTPVSQKKQRRSSSNYFVDSSKNSSAVETGVLHLHDVCSVKLKNVKSIRSGTTTTIGFALFMAQQRSGGKLREKCMVFLCFSRDICIQWATRIKKYLQENFKRPGRLLVLSSGTMAATQMWDDVVEPKLDMACIKTKYVDVYEIDSALEIVEKLLSEQPASPGGEVYDGLLVVGKVSLFSEVLNVIIKSKSAERNGNILRPDIPVGFVPTSSTSFVSNGIHGTSDTETAIFHVIYGCTHEMPVCEISDHEGNLCKYGLTCSYGFSGGDTVRDSTSKGFAAVHGSIKKSFAVTKAIVKRRSYPCQIMFKDGWSGDFAAADEQMFDKVKARDFSIVNRHFVLDEHENDHDGKITNGAASRDTDSGIFPKSETWNSVPCDNFVDITVTSLPQYDQAYSEECPLSAILLRDSASRKDLILGKGSQVSLSSMSKHKPEAQSKTEIIHGSEFVVKPVTDYGTSGPSIGVGHLSTWTVDGCCLKNSVQELHVRLNDHQVVLFGRAPYQPLALPATKNVLNLEANSGTVPLDSIV